MHFKWINSYLIYAVSCNCQMFQVNFIPSLVSTFWRRNVPDWKTAVCFFALCSKWSFLSYCVKTINRSPSGISKSSTNFFTDVPSPLCNKLQKDFRTSLDTTSPKWIFMAKECTWPLAPATSMLWETTEKTWQRSFTLIVAVKRCGRLIITGKSVLYFKSSER